MSSSPWALVSSSVSSNPIVTVIAVWRIASKRLAKVTEHAAVNQGPAGYSIRMMFIGFVCRMSRCEPGLC